LEIIFIPSYYSKIDVSYFGFTIEIGFSFVKEAYFPITPKVINVAITTMEVAKHELIVFLVLL
jgi:hypothetical protein